MNKNVLMILADGFEDVEALGTRDILLRGGVSVLTASITNSLDVTSSFKVKMYADTLLKDVNLNEFDVLVLPGGGLGTKNLMESTLVHKTIAYFINEKAVAAICAAPSILGKLGYLKNKKYTCFAGFNVGIDGIFTGEEVVRDDNIVTARAMNYYKEFAYEILKLLGLDNKVNEVAKAIAGKG